MNKNIVKTFEWMIGFLSAFFIFFGYVLGNSYPVLYLIILITFILFVSKRAKIIINKNILLWIISTGLFFICSLFSLDMNSGITLSISILLFIVLMIFSIDIKQEYWFKIFKKFIFIFGIIHVIFTLLYQIYPEFVDSICQSILKPEDLEVNRYLFKHFGNPGITGQTGINGWYISILTGLLVINTIQEKKTSLIKKIYYYLLIIASVIAIFFTNKRAYILFTSASIILTLYLGKNTTNKKINIKKIVPIILLISIILIIITKNNQLMAVFDRFMNSGDDISSGRYGLYETMFQVFLENPLLGIGTYSIPKIIGNLGHNIYLQILAENGIVGITLLLITFYSGVRLNINLIKKAKNQPIYNKKKKNLMFTLFIQFLFLLYGLTGNPIYSIQFFSVYFFAICYINIVHIKGGIDQ